MSLKARRETYTGSKARRYEAIRQGGFWDAEQATMSAILNDLPHATKLIDCPVGTGRFLAMYDELGIDATGVDLSDDMLAQAAKKGASATLVQGSLFGLDFDDDAFDVAVCVRILNWLETHELSRALGELGRVAPKVIAGAGTKNGDVAKKSVQCIHEERDFRAHVEVAGLVVVERHVVQHNARGDFHFWELARA